MELDPQVRHNPPESAQLHNEKIVLASYCIFLSAEKMGRYIHRLPIPQGPEENERAGVTCRQAINAQLASQLLQQVSPNSEARLSQPC